METWKHDDDEVGEKETEDSEPGDEEKFAGSERRGERGDSMS